MENFEEKREPNIKQESILTKAMRFLKRPLSITLLSSILSSDLSAQQYELKKDNPQRQVYARDYEGYKRYIDNHFTNELLTPETEIDKLTKKQISLLGYLEKAKEKKSEYLKNNLTEKAELEDKIMEQLRTILNLLNESLSSWIKIKAEIRYRQMKAQKMTEEDFNVLKEKILKAFQDGDSASLWFLKLVNSEEYRKRLIDSGGTEELLEERTKRIKEDFVIDDNTVHMDPDDEGYYVNGKIAISPKYEDKNVFVHEKQHLLGMTEAESKILQILSQSYINKELDRKGYYSSEKEIHADIRTFQYELEKLGIWKYGETFTEEHFKKAVESGKLSIRAKKFCNNIPKDLIIMAMNALAKNRQDKEIQEV